MKINKIIFLISLLGMLLQACNNSQRKPVKKKKNTDCPTCPVYSQDAVKPDTQIEYSNQEIQVEKLEEVQIEKRYISKKEIKSDAKMAPRTSGLSISCFPDSYSTEDEDIVDNSFNTESYSYLKENDFVSSVENPLSTFSIDVDAASYSNCRRYLNDGSLPPKDAVRIEEFINYFSYDYTNPKGEHPFSINTEIGECPWNTEHKLIHVGIQGKKYDFNELPNSNLVFLIDVSGSMDQPNKLPLLKNSFEMLVNKLREKDRISIVVYAGAAGMILPSTSGNEKQKILGALNKLNAGGSTAGGAGIKLAYKIAKENFIQNGINRVILATDGDFNVGVSSDGEMERLIEEKRDMGIFLSILGFGMGNYKDSKMESIADNGNGNYFYIDNMNEARKVLDTEADGTLFTIAKDVKIQIEFNPAKIKGYRLVGYENRMLNKEDFNDDKKDAGELGAGHTVTALYEIIPSDSKETIGSTVDPLKYQTTGKPSNAESNELMTIKFRYKNVADTSSKLIVHTLKADEKTINSENFRFSAAVAGFGLLLRDSKYKGTTDFKMVKDLAQHSKGKDEEGHRAEFISLVKLAESY